VLPTCANFSASLICVAAVALFPAPAVVALLDELTEALSPATFEAVSQAVKRKATAHKAKSR
jgi:ABC-type branched-subunit amino acid transport system ATPase component